MRILGLGVPELVVILVIVLLIFGPKNLPKIGSAVGKTFKNLREGMDGKDGKKAEAKEEAEEAETVEVAAADEKEEA